MTGRADAGSALAGRYALVHPADDFHVRHARGACREEWAAALSALLGRSTVPIVFGDLAAAMGSVVAARYAVLRLVGVGEARVDALPLRRDTVVRQVGPGA